MEGMFLEVFGDSLITRARMWDFDVDGLTQAFLETCHGVGFCINADATAYKCEKLVIVRNPIAIIAMKRGIEVEGQPSSVCLSTLAMGDAVEIAQQTHSNVLKTWCGPMMAKEVSLVPQPHPPWGFHRAIGH